MNRYGIDEIAEAVYQSSICPFMHERDCVNGNGDCQKCVKEWFADNDKQIIDEFVGRIKENQGCTGRTNFDICSYSDECQFCGFNTNPLSHYCILDEIAEKMKGE